MRIRPCRAAVALALSGAVAAALVMTAAVGTAAAAGPAPLDVKRYMPLSEIQPGMVGLGKTTLVGSTIIEFQVKVLAVLKRIGPKRDLIIVRCSGAGLEDSGIIAGMSGSPIYINGRLIGALAYAFPFAKLPIAGIQPIEQMLAVGDEQPWVEAKQAARAADPALPVPTALLGLAKLPAAMAGHETCDMLPIRAPVMVAGMAPRSLDELRDVLAPLGLVPMAGGGVDIDLPVASVLEPGAPLAIPMVRGDAEVTTMGTITDIVGDRVFGFGHGLLSSGETDLPLMTGIGHVVIPSLQNSFRMGAPVREVGRLTWDEEVAIVGRLTKDRAVLVPVSVKVVGPAKGRTQTYHYEVIHQRALTPVLASTVVANSLTGKSDLPRDHTITYRVTVRPVGEAPIVRENVVASPGGDVLMQTQVRLLMGQLLENPFRSMKIESVDIEATIEPVSRQAEIEEVRPLRNAVRPGGTMPLEVRIRPYHAEPVWIRVNVTVPAEYADGSFRVTVCGADEALRLETREAPSRFHPDSAAGLLAMLARQERRDQLFIRLESPGEGLAIGADELPNLPASMRAVLSDAARREVSPVTAARVTTRAVPYVLQGTRTVDLKVDRKAPEP